MSSLESFYFNQVNWSTAAAEILQIRQRVFVIEQRFTDDKLCDQYDVDCFHLLVTDESGKSVGCGRLNPSGKIGFIAVLMDQRGKGIGTMILNKLINIAEKNRITNLSLSVETDLIQFYNSQKFKAEGPVYMKHGIPFQRMTKTLD